MPIAPRSQDWFRYFPENYRWSLALMIALGSAPYGGAEIGEVDRAGRRLRSKSHDDDEAWFEAWTTLGDQVAVMADRAAAAGHNVTASSAYLRACNYIQTGERLRLPKDERANGAYRRAVDCFHKFARMSDDPEIEVVEIPYEGVFLPAYFVHAKGSADRTPSVVFFDGLDVTKELQFLRGVPGLVRRGISCLLVDGPGNGESVRFRALPLRHDYERAGSAAYDYLAGRADVDSSRIGVMALSLGGYYATRCAAGDPRFRACIAWGAIWNYYQTWKARIEQQADLATSVVHQHLAWVFGVSDVQAALNRLKEFTVEGSAIQCPFLLIHGEQDQQIPMSDARALFNAVGSPDKTLKVFTAEEGGAQHCQIDELTAAADYMWDWLAVKFGVAGVAGT